MIKRTLLMISLALCLRPLGAALADDWPQWRGPDRTGVSKETGLLQSWPPGGPKLLWTFRDAGGGLSSMAVVGDRLYSMGGDAGKDRVYAIDLKTQKKLWSVEVGELYQGAYSFGPRSTPTIDGDFLYALGGQGDLICVERASGKKVWSQRLQKDLGGRKTWWGYCESPLVDGDQVIASTDGKKDQIVAFDKKTGTLKWRSTIYTPDEYSVYQPSYASMIAIEIGGVRQYVHVAAINGQMVGVRASDGKLLWKVRHTTSNTPIFRDGCLFASFNLLKFAPDGDKFKVETIYNRGLGNQHGGIILVGEYLYGYFDGGTGYDTARGRWMCQEFKTGKAVWSKRLEDQFDMGRGTAVIYADGNLYGYHESQGDVLLIKAIPTGYQEQGRFRIPEEPTVPRKEARCWTLPVVANGKLYLRDQNLIFCYDVRKPS